MGFRILKVIVVAAGCVCISCSGQVTRQRVEVPLRRQSSIEPMVGTSAFTGSWTAGPDFVEGQVSLSRNCLTRYVEDYRVDTKVKTSPNFGGNLLWTAAGVGLAGYGVYTLDQSGSKSSEEVCTTGTDGKESCSSPQRDARLVGGFALVLGAAMAIVPVVIMARGSGEDLRPGVPGQRQWLGSDAVACGTASDLQGSKVTLSLGDGQELEGVLDSQGRTRIALPQGLQLDPSKRYLVRVSSVNSGRLVFAAGQAAGDVDLTAYVQGQQDKHQAIMAEADRQVFEGAIHGDDQIRAAFTTECSASGKDVCFDAIDNDCDGLYDVGCGYQSGALQWTLAWRTGDDLDLHVIGPDGAHVWYQHKRGGQAGLSLDVDCLGQFGSNCLSQNVENIFTPRDRKPMEGTYRGWVEVFRAVESEEAGRVIEAMLGGRLAGRSFRMPMKLQAQGQVRLHFAFAIGPDRDKDSVIDRQDACPDQAGVYSLVAPECGCPDQDMDGVADKVDACPSEAGVRNTDPRQNGCAKSYGHARLTARGVEIDTTIRFATGSATLLRESYPVLRDVARVMREVPHALQEISIEGHTDDVGEDSKNYALSRERVRSVVKHLVDKEKIAAARLRYAWFGEARPIRDNATEAGRTANRRVEFRVVKPEPEIAFSW